MNVIGIGLKALKEIIDNKTSYHIVLERMKSQYNLNEDDKKRLYSIVLGSMRHFTYLQYEATSLYTEFQKDDDEIYLLIISLFEIRYKNKIIAPFLTIEDACATSGYLQLRFDINQLQENLNTLSKSKTLLPDTLFKDPYKYNSLFFSTPEWLIKMWAKQYGDETCMNILLSNQRHQTIFLAVNTLKVSRDEIVEAEYYNPVDACDTAVIYSSHFNFSEQVEASLGKLYVQDLSLQVMLDQIEYFYGMHALHLNGITGSLSSNVAIRLASEEGKIETVLTNEVRYRRCKYQYSRLDLKNANAIFSKLSLVKTYCIYNDYDLVFVTPPSSYLGQIRRRPDILVTIDKKDIKDIVIKQKEMLNEAKDYVRIGGQLVYSVQTINLDETKEVVEDFIRNNDNYELVTSRQIFPFEFNSDGLYYAILRKN